MCRRRNANTFQIELPRRMGGAQIKGKIGGASEGRGTRREF